MTAQSLGGIAHIPKRVIFRGWPFQESFLGFFGFLDHSPNPEFQLFPRRGAAPNHHLFPSSSVSTTAASTQRGHSCNSESISSLALCKSR